MDKFAIKLWLAVGIGTKYIVNIIPYLFKDKIHVPSHRLSNCIVIKLMEPYLGKGRNVTTDNFFTLYILAKQLW